MTQRANDDEPFDLRRWADSVGDRTVRITARTPETADRRRDGSRRPPAEPVECGLCGAEVLPVSRDPAEPGHCPCCGFEPCAER